MKLKHTCTLILCLFSILIIAASIFAALPPARAAAIPLTIIGSDGSSYPILDIKTLTPTIGSGGYKSNSQLNAGIYQGVSLLTLCNAPGNPLASYQNVTVATSGGSGTTITFNYEQVANGTSIYPQYNTYNNATGAATAPTQPVTLIVAYQFANGSALPGTGATRLMIVGPEGLLFVGPGLASVDNITITNVGPVPTPSPTPSPTPVPATPTPSPIPTASPTQHPTASPSPTPSPTPPPTASPTPTASPSPTPNTNQNAWPIAYTVAIAAAIAAIVIAAVAIILKKR